MSSFVRAYLRASTEEQDANRARKSLEEFAERHGLKIAASYMENESGAKLARPELFRLLNDCHPGDILLIHHTGDILLENPEERKRLWSQMNGKAAYIVAGDLPLTHEFLQLTGQNEIAKRVRDVVLEMLDLVAAGGLGGGEAQPRTKRDKAKRTGHYKGRPEDANRNADLLERLARGDKWKQISAETGASSSTLARLAKRLKESGSAA